MTRGRVLIAGIGASGSMLVAAACAVLLAGSVVAFRAGPSPSDRAHTSPIVVPAAARAAGTGGLEAALIPVHHRNGRPPVARRSARTHIAPAARRTRPRVARAPTPHRSAPVTAAPTSPVGGDRDPIVSPPRRAPDPPVVPAAPLPPPAPIAPPPAGLVAGTIRATGVVVTHLTAPVGGPVARVGAAAGGLVTGAGAAVGDLLGGP